MKNKLYGLYKKYKLTIIIALCIIILGLVGAIIFLNLSPSSNIKEFKNDNYNFKYDNNWDINLISDKSITLVHNKGSKLNIEIVDLQEEYKYLPIEDILDELLYDIEIQNTNFKLLYKEKASITKAEYDGYKMLYENNDSQAMTVIAKKSNKLIIFIYEATNNYFDILLDSVHNIIYNFDTTEEKFDLTYNLKLETSEIKYEETNESIISLLDKTNQYEIAYNNYYVQYSIPSNFKLSSINSTAGYFNFDNLESGKISLNVNVYNRNIYEYLDKNKSGNIYSMYKAYSTNEDYSNFKESIDKFNSNFESYIYKNSYYYDKALSYDENFNSSYTSELRENITLIYALDRNHILLITISSDKVAIPKELINMINVDLSENYASFTDSINKDGYILSNLKRIVDSSTKSVEEIKLKIPDKFKEFDNNYNIYEKRYYKLNYNEKLDVYDYDVSYTLTTKYTDIEGQIDMINNSFSKSYGEYNFLKYTNEKVINNKKFKIYDGGYTSLSGIMFTSKNREKYYKNIKVLFYELSNGGYLIIKIEGNDVTINDETLNDLTNFEIKK